MCNKIRAIVAVKELLVTKTGTHLFNEFRITSPIQRFITILKKHETIPVLTQISPFHICKIYILMTHFGIIPSINFLFQATSYLRVFKLNHFT